MTGPTRNLVTVGTWASVKGGKWHIPKDAEGIAFRADAVALCGLMFEPFNICINEAPPTADPWICKACAKAHRATD